ncbi:Biotin-protein ligase/Biotin operon repressor [Dehalogenimonas sp. WBC-2]|nr:Biotin-protein ligase/Biotin operon repressor [Dehalogenimonas sp. WBC-2]
MVIALCQSHGDNVDLSVILFGMGIINFRTVQNALAGCAWGDTLLTYDRIGSTMDKARELANKKAPEGTLVVAAEQTSGRGRLTRHWLSPEGSLSLSVLLYPPVEDLPYLTMMAGLAVTQAIEAAVSVNTGLKWPNDVLLDNRKVAGILVESGVVADKPFAIIGIGVNVNVDISQYHEVAAIATSLSDATGGQVDILKLLRAVIVNLEDLYLNFDGRRIYESWCKWLITIGLEVRAFLGDQVIDGTAIGVRDNGALIIRKKDGSEHDVVAGDVMLRHA